MKIVLATHNRDKQKEILNSLSEFNIQILTLGSFPEIAEIIEDGDTLTENALIKAREVHRFTGLPTISDDSGLEVDILDGSPGVFSARYGGENCSYSDNVKKLLLEMEGVPYRKRSATFRTVMAYVQKDRELIAHGEVKGYITESLKGIGGFGYDPVFYYPEMEKTFAEMSIDEKNKISHRGVAIRNLKELLQSFIKYPQIQENA